MTRDHAKKFLIESAVVLACCTSLTAVAAPDDPPLAGRVVRPVNIAHNEQGDISPMAESRNGCRQESPWFSGIGHLADGFESHAMGVSPDGNYVVGSSTGFFENNSGYMHGIAWSACFGLQRLAGTPEDAWWSTAYSISNTGRHVAGQVSMDFEKAALWLNRTDGIQSLVNPEFAQAQSTIVRSVSADGQTFAGTAQDADGREAFIYVLDTEQALMLGDLPGGEASSEALALSHNANAVVGRSSSEFGTEAFLWRSDLGMIGLGDLPGGSFDSEATAVNADGTVVVGSASTANGRRAFRWTAATGMVDIGDLSGGADYSEALGVSADGNVIVGHASTDAGDEAFIWTPGAGIRSLHQITENRIPGDYHLWALTAVRGVSADGTILAGSGVNPEGYVEGWVMELPRTCRADWTQDGLLNTNDFFAFLDAFFRGNADFTGDYVTNTQDFFSYLSAFFAGC
jgi:probable HAF family extracellular repeat protein